MSEFRGFIAIDINTNNNIEKFVKELKNSGAIIKLVELKNIHITIKFLGKISDNIIEKIEDIIKNATNSIQPFQIKLEGTGVFPNQDYIKIIWIGIKNTEILKNITKKIEYGLNNLNFVNKTQEFSPHITIGRVKSAKDKDKILEIIEKYKNTKFSEILIDSIKLKKSELTSKGPIYTDLIKVDFNKGVDKCN
ncbi:MAG: RNA 2',3'-cyclic phosphodiesterase [Thermoplasmatales archaeon]|nr:RNA 2',3'-cyclic phosphodiesterase [Thermoplasmatales archaeon]